MATIVMNIDGCDIAHEALLLKEFGEEVRYAGQEPQLRLASERSVAQTSMRAHAQGHARISIVDLPSACNEVGDSVRFVLSSAFPKCP